MSGVLPRSAPSYLAWQEGDHHGGNSPHGAVGTQPDRGDCSALVLPQSFSCHSWSAGLPAIHGCVRRQG